MFIEEPYIVYFVAKSRTPASINLIVRKPDGQNEGFFVLTEFDPSLHPGVYAYEYTPRLEGNYLFSVFENGKHKVSKTEYCELKALTQRPSIDF